MSPDVSTRLEHRTGRITLNRPRALNALTADMISEMSAALHGWQDDPDVDCLVIDGAGERAFCAGGDVRAVRTALASGDEASAIEFFRREYALNRTLARYRKPIISLIDGIWMGGGAGLAMHGWARVVSERASFAMPEVQIGFFPDVGASYLLPRIPGGFGLYLGLTGARVDGALSCHVGLATHYVPSAGFAGLADAVVQGGIGALAERAEPPPASPAPDTSAFLQADGVPAIVARLSRQTGSWADAALAAMRAASPTALVRTFALLDAGRRHTFEHCQRIEFGLLRQTLRHPDFAEGVRAMVVDKDHRPAWSPPDLAAIDMDGVTRSLEIDLTGPDPLAEAAA